VLSTAPKTSSFAPEVAQRQPKDDLPPFSGKVCEISSAAPNTGVGGVEASPDDRRIYFCWTTIEAAVWPMSRD
jgi:hypothetical protein